MANCTHRYKKNTNTFAVAVTMNIVPPPPQSGALACLYHLVQPVRMNVMYLHPETCSKWGGGDKASITKCTEVRQYNIFPLQKPFKMFPAEYTTCGQKNHAKMKIVFDGAETHQSDLHATNTKTACNNKHCGTYVCLLAVRTSSQFNLQRQ